MKAAVAKERLEVAVTGMKAAQKIEKAGGEADKRDPHERQCSYLRRVAPDFIASAFHV